MDERVRHVMTAPVRSIGMDEPITEVLRFFATHDGHHLPVLDGFELKGMLSSADLLKLEHFVPKSGSLASAAVLNARFQIATMMRRPVIAAQLDDTIADAASRMAGHGIHALAVVDENSQLVGIVTTTDIMQALLHGMGRSRSSVQATTQAGKEGDGVASTLSQLRDRNALLEVLRQDVARYLNAGPDEQMHARLVKDLDRLGQPATEFSLRL